MAAPASGRREEKERHGGFLEPREGTRWVRAGDWLDTWEVQKHVERAGGTQAGGLGLAAPLPGGFAPRIGAPP